ncbi:MAG: hypothetical protein EOO01_04950 [Chitinophagaceae bacterium]|nr:MAG: hypothetical protein EOO01_04950 [Chitinophagaceae bacterium]
MFKKILVHAGQVTEETFPALIAKNPRILFLDHTNKPTGIGALKIPHKSYKDSVFSKAKSEKNPDDFKFELGWVVSLSKGNGNRITAILAEYADIKTYATVREDNVPMINLLKKYEFEQSGVPYPTTRNNQDYTLLLFIKSARQDSGLPLTF